MDCRQLGIVVSLMTGDGSLSKRLNRISQVINIAKTLNPKFMPCVGGYTVASKRIIKFGKEGWLVYINPSHEQFLLKSDTMMVAIFFPSHLNRERFKTCRHINKFLRALFFFCGRRETPFTHVAECFT